jgi:hypothetical protein
MIALHALLHADADGATVVCRDGARALTLAGFRARVATRRQRRATYRDQQR